MHYYDEQVIADPAVIEGDVDVADVTKIIVAVVADNVPFGDAEDDDG